MVVTTVMIEVLKQHIDDFIEATIVNHEASVKESGNRRFDLLQRVDDPSSLYFMRLTIQKNRLQLTKTQLITRPGATVLQPIWPNRDRELSTGQYGLCDHLFLSIIK